MNIISRINILERESISITNSIKELKAQYTTCRDFTSVFLKICRKYKINKVAIGTKHDSIESSKGFPFGCSDNIFSDNVKHAGSPAIWRAVEDAGIANGCGNHMQHQANCSNLVDGVYHFKAGKWVKLHD